MERWKIPTMWEWLSLEQVAETTGGAGFPKQHQGYTNLPVPFIKVSDMNLSGNEQYIKTSVNSVDEKIIDEIRAKIFPSGTIIFPKVGGAIATNKKRILDIPSTFDNNVMGVVSNQQRVIVKWLYYYLCSFDLMELARIGPVPSIRQSAVQEMVIPIPYPDDPVRSLAEQRRIVARIEALFAELRACRVLNEKIQASTDRLMNSVLKETFDELKAEFRLGSIGDTDVCTIHPGQHILAENYSTEPPGTPYITGPADFGERYPIISRWTNSPKTLCQPGDVLFTVKGSGVGKVNCSPKAENCSISRQIMALRPNTDRLNTEFLYFCLRGRYQEFQLLRQGAAIPGIRKDHVEAIEMPIPNISIQRHVVNRLELIEQEVKEMQKSQTLDSSRLEQFEQGILMQAFRGEL